MATPIEALRAARFFLRCLLGGVHDKKDVFHEGGWRAALTLRGRDGANVADLQALYDLVCVADRESAEPLTPATVPYDKITDPTQALLWFADEGHYEGTYRRGAGFADALGIGIARRALGLPADRADGSLMPLAEALEQRQTMAPRTPEVVLRAMLRAYEAAAFEALVKHYQAEDGQGEAELEASEVINGLVNELRSEAAHASAGYPAHDLTTPRLIADYEARLAGTRPLDAPPLEVL